MHQSNPTMSGGDGTAPHVVEDLLGVVKLLSDGSVVRGDESVLSPPQQYPDVPGVEWKDVVYHAAHGLKARVYRPSSEKTKKKLPVLVYFHGGGYCIGSYAQPPFHAFCRRAAAELPALVLSAQYRLAPEHRLPAAISDGADFLSWLRAQAETPGAADTWLAESADFARTFVSGVSAGANLAHHVTVQNATSASPVRLRIAGLVLLSAFFGGVRRTPAETALSPADVSLTVDVADQLWRLALPAGATRDHPLANPEMQESLAAVAELPPALVVAPGRDVLRDRVLGYAARLTGMGKAVEVARFDDEQHGFSVLHPFGAAADQLMQVLRSFLYRPTA